MKNDFRYLIVFGIASLVSCLGGMLFESTQPGPVEQFRATLTASAKTAEAPYATLSPSPLPEGTQNPTVRRTWVAERIK